MSKYSKSGKRSQSGAGNHFDKLLKVCSNSKVAGSLGRFGVASFTSIRSTATNEPPAEEKKPKAKYSSFKKRARLDPAASKTDSLSVVANVCSNSMPTTPNTPATTVYKPRKFFKSRGPMEVELGSSPQFKPIRPEIGNLMPALAPPPPLVPSSPLIPSNTNTNYVDRNHQPKKHKKHGNKKHENLSSPPQTSLSSGSTSDTNFVSPPIKLRIFKDRGKFVAEAPTVPIIPPTATGDSPKGKKRGRKPGSKNKKIEEFDTEEQKPPKQTKRGRKPAVPSVEPPSAPQRASGRTTRNSIRRGADTSEDSQEDSTMPSLDRELRNSFDGTTFPQPEDMYQGPPPPDLMVGIEQTQPIVVSQSPAPAPAQEIIKKLEDDADFKKLSEMLSSMEHEDNGTSSYNPALQHQTQQPREPETDFNNVFLQQSQRQESQGEGFPVNLSGGGNSGGIPQGLSAFAAQAYMQQQFRQQMQQQQQVDLNRHEQNLIVQQQQRMEPQEFYNGSMDAEYQQQSSSQQQPSSSVQLPQQQNIPKANDIRSILVDDWTDFGDDESHSPQVHSRSGSRPSSQQSHHGSHQSPPKFSRFDMSAFMPSGHKDQQQNAQYDHHSSMDMHHHQQQQQSQYGDSHPEHHHQQQMPFNIHSSPYAMRNLLNCPQPGAGHDPHFSAQQEHEQQQQQQQHSQQDFSENEVQTSSMQHFSSCALESLQQHAHSAPLNSLSSCAKQEAISVLDSVLKQQQDHTNPALLPPPMPSAITKAPLVPTTRKASIFKSRAREQSQNGEGTFGVNTGNDTNSQTKGSSKRLALYRHKFGGQEEAVPEEQRQQCTQPSGSIFNEFDEEEDDDKVINTLRNVRVKNVKAVHQLQESGEFHEFDGDVQYILENLKSKNTMNIRCLSAVTLATRCMEPSFRMHLRAHGTVAEFCRELHDSPQHPELALLAALVLFVLSQDRLNMDLDTDTLKLILALSKADDCNEPDSQESLESLKHRQRVLDLCVEMKNRGHATHLKLDRITASELALETLLHLTSKRAGEWVKHELRALGGLDSIVNEVETSLRYAQIELTQFGWTEGALERLRKVDRCLQVLQQVTFNHEDNQKYLLGQSVREIETPNGGALREKCVEASPKIFVELFRFCKDTLLQLNMQLESAAVMREILFSVLRVLVNLSHDYRGIVLGSEILLAMDGFLQLCLHSTFEMGRYFPDEKIFDLLMHSLCMLLNLVEHSRACRSAIQFSTVQKSSAGNYRVLDSSSSVASDDSGVDEEIPVLDAFVEMFLCRERAAKKEENNTDNILTKGPGDSNSSQGDSGNASQDKNSQDVEGSSLQDTIDKLIQTAGKHMENSLIAAYISLLLAYLIMDNPMAANQVRQSMPNGQYLPLMIFLKKLFNFMSITSSASGSIRGLKATAIALRFYAQGDPASEEELKRLIPD